MKGSVMRPIPLAVGLVGRLMSAAFAATPEQAWKKGIAEENDGFAKTAHAVLKIQSAAYIGEGQVAVLNGIAGRPQSWQWDHAGKREGLVRATIIDGRLILSKDGKPVPEAVVKKSLALDKDIDLVGQPTQVGAGVNGWRLFIFNQQAAAAKAFKGVSYYPYDPAFRLEAAFVPDAKLPPHVFRTSRGTDKQFYHAGDAHFELRGQKVSLAFYMDSTDPQKIGDMSAFYHDRLTGKGAYGAGRYVDVDKFGKFPPAKVIIDFNFAYNPNCARSAHFTCPLAVDNIPVAMAAGEKDPHYP